MLLDFMFYTPRSRIAQLAILSQDLARREPWPGSYRAAEEDGPGHQPQDRPRRSASRFPPSLLARAEQVIE